MFPNSMEQRKYLQNSAERGSKIVRHEPQLGQEKRASMPRNKLPRAVIYVSRTSASMILVLATSNGVVRAAAIPPANKDRTTIWFFFNQLLVGTFSESFFNVNDSRTVW